ncbi:MAG TPA: hypothetical protein DDX54_04975, partial [Rhodospirillaceae bacterium]|nr:hypothetical protein [Rhodospirillaceae bacterium]
LEAALRLRESGLATEIVAVTLGAARAVEQLRTARAMGADRLTHVVHEGPQDALAVARCLAAVARREGPGLILAGKQDTDTDAGAVGPMLAGLLGWAQATAASSLKVEGHQAFVTREVEGGTQDLRLRLPAVVTCELNLAQPRKAPLPAVIKAKAAPVEALTPDGLGIDMALGYEVVSLSEPPPRAGLGVRVDSPEALASILREKGF